MGEREGAGAGAGGGVGGGQYQVRAESQWTGEQGVKGVKE